MDFKNIYYVEVYIALESDVFRSGLHNPLCLVIADSENEALTKMKNYLSDKDILATVSIPSGATVEVGHGTKVNEYLEDPRHKGMTWNDIIDAQLSHYCRYELQILDERGEILMLNDYQHPENFPEPPKPLKNKYVPIFIEDADKLDSGIAFVADETEEDSQAWVLTAEKITSDSGEVTIKQCQYKANGELNTRKCINGVFTEWEHVYVEEIPNEDKYFMRHYDASLAEDGFPWVWVGYTWDSKPTANSNQLVNSGNIYDWVKKEISKMYEICGSATCAQLSALKLTQTDEGNVYQVTDKGTITWSGGSINVNAGDNVVWTGDAFDSLAHFIDSDLFVKFTDLASASKTGAVKVNSSRGISISSDGTLNTVKATDSQIKALSDNYAVITPSNLKTAVKTIIPDTVINTSAPNGGTLVTNQEYYLGSQYRLNLTMPTTASVGDTLIINFSWISSSVLEILNSFSLGNAVGNVPNPEVGKSYHITAKFDGSNWVCDYIEY